MKRWIGIVGIFVVIIAGIVVWQFGGIHSHIETPAPSFPVALASGDEIASWNFIGAYTGQPELEQKAAAEVERLTGLLGTGEYTDYTLYVSIANQYDLIGDGTNELASLEKALAIDSTQTGLAWHNIGQLFARIGAYQTARAAFERAVDAQPTQQYEQALADFVQAHPETTAVP